MGGGGGQERGRTADHPSFTWLLARAPLIITRSATPRASIWSSVKVSHYPAMVKRALTATLGAAGVAFSALLTALPAQAATISITCPGANTSVISSQTIAASDVLVITATSCTQFQIPAAAAGSATYGGVAYGPGSTVAYSGGEVTYLPPRARMTGSQEIEFINNSVTPRGAFSIYITVTATDIAEQMWFQSVGRDAAATCPTGWGASWEQWPNGGTGGFTCNRQVVGTGGFAFPTVTGNPGVG